MNDAPVSHRSAVGIEGLDDVLGGGLRKRHLYLIQGNPGSGKTTLAMQFLITGCKKGEKVLYVTPSETADDLREMARSHAWDLDGVDIYEHSPAAAISLEAYHTLFHPDEVDLAETMANLLKVVDRIQPQRVVFDSLSELRLLAGDDLRYRRQIMALRDDFVRRGCTVLLLDDKSVSTQDLQLQSVVHGVISLQDIAPEYGTDRRRLRIVKMRGQTFRGGFHDYVIETGGIRVFPRLIAAEHGENYTNSRIESGLPTLDQLFGGGLDKGTTTLFMGPSGTGKSTIAVRYAVSAAERGEKVAFYAFDERLPTLLQRAAGLGMSLQKHIESGSIIVQMIDPAELTPGEFAHIVRNSTETYNVSMVVIDSLSGYLNAMPETRQLLLQLHELLTYLGQMGTTTLMVVAQHGMLVSHGALEIDVSYLSDNVLLFRYYEFDGEVRVALSVFKRRAGGHERTIRLLTLGGANNIEIGAPLRGFHGVLSGLPIFKDSEKETLSS